MTPEEIQKMKETFIDYCHKYIQREGLEKLLDYLEKSDFFTAPSSASYHLNEEGGLCRHSINVFETAMTLYENVVKPAIESGNSPFTEPLKTESIAIAALFHDLCKTSMYRRTEKYKKDEHGRWVTYPGYEIDEKLPFGHGEKSCLIICWMMKLSEEELLAIRWHMGMFDMAENGSAQRYSFRSAMERSPLVALLQAADMLTANVMEKTTKH